jgi:hypothetical protein
LGFEKITIALPRKKVYIAKKMGLRSPGKIKCQKNLAAKISLDSFKNSA